MSQVRKVQSVRIEIVFDEGVYEVELTKPDQIELGGLGDLVAELGLERDTMEMPSDDGWRNEVGLDTATVTLKAHGKFKAERRAR